MTEITARPPEVHSLIVRPLTTEDVLYRYRHPRPGEVIDKDAWQPGYARLPEPEPTSIQQAKKLYFPYTDEAGVALSREVRLQYPDGRKQPGRRRRTRTGLESGSPARAA
jgi:hypothetical protein